MSENITIVVCSNNNNINTFFTTRKLNVPQIEILEILTIYYTIPKYINAIGKCFELYYST